MKFFVVFLFCVLSSIESTTQNHTIDSIKILLAYAKEDSSHVNLLGSLSSLYSESFPDSSLKLDQEALLLAKKINYTKGEILSISNLGFISMTRGDYITALELLFQAKKLNEAEPAGLVSSGIYQNLGLTYFYMTDFLLAKEYFLKAKTFRGDVREDAGISVLYMNLARAYLKLNNLDSALIFASEAYRINILINNSIGQATTLLTLGEIHERQGNESIGFEFYKKAIPAAFAENGRRPLIRCYQALTNYYFKKKNSDSALAYGRKALSEAQFAGYTQHEMELAGLLSQIYNQRYQYDSAFVYLSLSTISKDKMYNQEKQSRMQNLAFAEILRDQETAQKEKEAGDQRRQNLQYIIIAIGLISFIILFFLLSHSIIVNPGLIKFLGVIGLLIMFEFINLLLHPFLERITYHSPLLILLVLVLIAALLIPLHHRLQKSITHKMIEKNKKIRLMAARKTIEQLEGSTDDSNV